ncbi:LacI family DNA-binding transcriptional regulator [Phycicoccus sp. BSK3Z-2]|uniref:LacI family DNA-binding transcriptional regulator n=1 Tax=Phycicoccus avicenniae TaxID=2828860 RepID=A0A941D449_9MICO|nr:LacI family DNA-binding transcriptional regulator [Phycicoccus avicenniae]MBR7741759.1 LacI family DNA-binding transcriptional regulator [Phycicoccus avicenniae]
MSAVSRAASVKDVAERAGVSLGTVSNVLNRPSLVRESTRAKVEAAIAELGFVRNESARQLRAGRSSVLAYVLLDARNPFFTDVARGIEDATSDAGLSLFMCDSREDAVREAAYLHKLGEQRVQGVLITPVDPTTPLLDELPGRGTPVVLVDRTRELSDWGGCWVTVNDVLGGRLAVEHLLARGHRRIAFIGGPARLGQVRDRRAGAREVFAESGLPAQDLVELATDSLSVEEGRRAAHRLLSMPASERPTAAFCANDLVALGVLQRCIEDGGRVPEDLAIVGYDDIDFAAAAAVPLTSVSQPRYELGYTAARLLIEEQNDPGHAHQQVEFDPRLVARRSTAAG